THTNNKLRIVFMFNAPYRASLGTASATRVPAVGGRPVPPNGTRSAALHWPHGLVPREENAGRTGKPSIPGCNYNIELAAAFEQKPGCRVVRFGRTGMTRSGQRNFGGRAAANPALAPPALRRPGTQAGLRSIAQCPDGVLPTATARNADAGGG